MLTRVNVLGVGINTVEPRTALEEITRWVDGGQHQYVCVTGVHGVMESQRDPALLSIHNRSGLTTPDGMPMVWAGHFAGARDMRRVYGPDLMLSVCERAAVRGWRVYLYGGDDGVPELLESRLEARFPGLRVVGTHSPPFRALTKDEDDAEVDAINASAPDLVWVGLSTPKQERWMAAHRGRLDAAVLLGVGAAFDIHAGTLRQAPRLIQRIGMEWLFRLTMEPRRLWRRYLVNIPSFVFGVMCHPPRLMPVPMASNLKASST